MTVVSDFTALLSGASVNGTSELGAFVSFSFPTAVPDYLHGVYSDAALATFRTYSEAEKAAARAAIDAWAQVSGLTFFEVAAGEGDIKFMNYDLALMQPDAAGFAYLPLGQVESRLVGDVFMDNGYGANTHVLLHEIGHTLGLKHPFQGNVTLNPSLDNFNHTVMSYTSGGSAGNVLGDLDIAAIRSLYGDQTRDGLQVASWNFNAATKVLTQGGTAGADNLFGIGGSDVINALGGDDLLIGREGLNQLNGGDGNDILRNTIGGAGSVLVGGADNDTIESGPASATLLGGTGDDMISIDLERSAVFTIDGGIGTDQLNFNLYNYRAATLSIPALLAAGSSIAGIETVRFNIAADDTLSRDITGSDVSDVMFLRSGDDSASGGAGGDYIYGNGGLNTLFGDAGDDWLWGGTGIDTLSGGSDSDNLFGNGGQDRLYGDGGDDFLNYLLDGPYGASLIDGGAGYDFLRVELGGAVTTVSVASLAPAGIESVTIVGGLGNDTLIADAAIASISLEGGAGDDILRGGAAQGYMMGGAGNDTLQLGAGYGALYGGTGADLFVIGGPSLSQFGSVAQLNDFETGIDRIDLSGIAPTNVRIISRGSGNDIYADTVTGHFEVFVRAAVSLSDLVLTSNAINGTSEADRLIGTAAANIIDGMVGDDVIDGGLGDDILTGGTGNDMLTGGGGIDSVGYANAGAAVTVNLLSQSAQNTGGAGIDTIRTVENVIGSAYNDVLTGNQFGNSLDGGAGDDMLAGGLGNDVMIGGAGSDTANYGAATLAVKVNLTIATVQSTGGAGADTLTGIENLNGTGFDDQFTGDAANNALVGNGGNDLLIGGLGNDLLSGGAGIDTVSYAGATIGVTVNMALTTAQDTIGAGIDTFASIENLVGSAQNDQLTGSVQANVIAGGNGNDLVDGGIGSAADTLDGGAGNDMLKGQAGNDQLTGGTGNDSLDGGAGVDTIAYAVTSAGVTVNLGLTTAQAVGGGQGSDTIVNVENISGSAFGDTLTGNALANALTGGAGRDVLTGGAGNDRFIYLASGDSAVGANADRIADFALGDILDLSAIDANANSAGTNEAFVRVGAFTGVAGQFTLAFAAGANLTTLLGDTNGDGAADFSILFTGNVMNLTTSWVL